MFLLQWYACSEVQCQWGFLRGCWRWWKMEIMWEFKLWTKDNWYFDDFDFFVIALFSIICVRQLFMWGWWYKAFPFPRTPIFGNSRTSSLECQGLNSPRVWRDDQKLPQRYLSLEIKSVQWRKTSSGPDWPAAATAASICLLVKPQTCVHTVEDWRSNYFRRMLLW